MIQALLVHWFLTLWPGPGLQELKITVIQWPEVNEFEGDRYEKHHELHQHMTQCWEMRDLAEANGYIAMCSNTAWRSGMSGIKLTPEGEQFNFYPHTDRIIISKPGVKATIWALPSS